MFKRSIHHHLKRTILIQFIGNQVGLLEIAHLDPHFSHGPVDHRLGGKDPEFVLEVFLAVSGNAEQGLRIKFVFIFILDQQGRFDLIHRVGVFVEYKSKDDGNE